jgi:polysaccharide export outer membrane protein
MMCIIRLAPVATVALGLAACSSGVKLDESSRAVAVATALPAPDQTGLSRNLSNYRIAPLDQIKVEVFGAPELTREGEVDLAGSFSMPLVGSVTAGGRTPTELGEEVRSKLQGRYLKNPQVSVNVLKAQAQTFTVDGAVQQPGVYPIVGQITLQQAIATARGANDTANINNVVVFRTVSGKKMAALFSLKDVRSGRIPDPDIYGNDIIVVGENATRRFFRDLTSSFPLLNVFVPVI